MIPLQDDKPTRGLPLVSYTLIAACSLAFLWQLSLETPAANRLIYSLGVIPAVLFGKAALPEALSVVPAWVTMFTSMFLHGGWMHLLGNMLYLWIFGDNIEDRLGRVRFVLFYAVCGVIAVLAQGLPDTASRVPMIGASGAISGVLGAYLLLYPTAQVLVVLPLGFVLVPFRIRAMWVLGAWFAVQLASSAFAPADDAGVAFGAHIGGFIAGLVLVKLFVPRRVKLARTW